MLFTNSYICRGHGYLDSLVLYGQHKAPYSGWLGCAWESLMFIAGRRLDRLLLLSYSYVYSATTL